MKKTENKNNKRTILRFFILSGIATLLATISINIASFFYTDFDQFNIFYKYKKVHRLETWNISNNVDVDINGDGIDDRISWTGCVFLSGTLDKDITAKQYDCYNPKSNGIAVFNPKEFIKHQVRLSYLGETSDSWDIVLIRNWHTDSHSISKQGAVVINKPTIKLQIDSFVYFITHLFVLFVGM